METILVPILMIGVASAALIFLTVYFFDALYWSQHSARVITQIGVCRSLTYDFEQSKRGYLFAADNIFLETHDNAASQIRPAFDDLRMKVCNNPDQVARVVALKNKVLALLASGQDQMTARAQNQPVNPALVLSDKHAMDGIRSRFDSIQTSEEKISAQRFGRLRRAKSDFILVGITLAVLLPALIGLTVRRQFSRIASHYRNALTTLERRSNELLEQKEWFRVTLTSIGEAVIVTDEGGRVVFMNPEAERMTAWSTTEALRRPLAEVFNVVNEDTGANIDNPMEKVLREGRPTGLAKHTVLLSRSNGKAWPIDESAAPVVDGAGKLRGMVLIFHDVSVPRQETKILRDRTTVLEATVTETTATLRKSINRLESFSYSVSHDLRAPLRAMQGYAEVILDDHGESLNPDVRSHVLKIRSSALRLHALIRDLLAYARVTEDESALVPVELDKVVRDVIAADPDLRDDSSGIEVRNGGSWPRIVGREAAVTQIVTSLLDNAVKFRSTGIKPQVVVQADDLGDKVRFSVADNGIGIAPHNHERIFRIFEQVSEEAEGTGVGLAIVSRAIDSLGGACGVESAEGRGARFWCDFKKAEAA